MGMRSRKSHPKHPESGRGLPAFKTFARFHTARKGEFRSSGLWHEACTSARQDTKDQNGLEE